MKAFKDLSLKERTEIGQFYKDGLEANAIAPLYGTDVRAVQNVVTYLRTHGVEIPYKIKRWKKKTATTPELLVLPEEPKPVAKTSTKKDGRFIYKNSDKRTAYSMYRHDGIDAVVAHFKTTKSKAYYLMQEGRELSGVKGKRYNTVKPAKEIKRTEKMPTESKMNGDNIGFLIVGGVVGLLAGLFY